MSAKKKGGPRQQQRRRKPFRITPSKVFVGIIILMIAVAAIASAIGGGDDPECPPGQVWSDAHNHCH